MLADHTTLDQHIALLQDKGYLEANFKTATQVGYWLKELQEQFDQSYQQAHLAGEATRFIATISGRFNADLDLLHCSFRYRYDPQSDALSLTSLYTKLYQFKRPYYLDKQMDLPSAQDVYDRLAVALAKKEHEPLFCQLRQEFQREKDPANDYHPPNPRERPFIHPLDLRDAPAFRLKIRR
ncbi:MAG TPA: hypothetical protein VHE34_21090 [Puia sp.]|uniref:hypothetical protein n=1 Tax=Puia sp. TaxID=2045100 RepID=UPI002CD1A5B7|nr:hypothetical protein [Puia sp.]HVU97739.1 hypothetical protein [Puia sp.]